jgi:hypothetical protein
LNGGNGKLPALDASHLDWCYEIGIVALDIPPGLEDKWLFE